MNSFILCNNRFDSNFFVKFNQNAKSNQIHRFCLDISYSYFYILHIVDEIVVASYGSAVAFEMCCVDGDFADDVDLIVAVVVTMQWDTDVTSSLCQLMDDILGFDSKSLDQALLRREN